MTPINKVEDRLLIGSLDDVPDIINVDNTDFIILASSIQDKPVSKSQKVYIPVVAGKKGQNHFLQTTLPTATALIRDRLADGKRICIVCESGKDLSVGVALAALQLFFQDNGRLVSIVDPDLKLSQGAFYILIYLQSHGLICIIVDKKSIRTRLEWIIASRPQANPSRATLKRVNEFLLSPPSLWRVSPLSSFPHAEPSRWTQIEHPEAASIEG
jgi:tRNA A64-2'-O-ribosylphosphate transferase